MYFLSVTTEHENSGSKQISSSQRYRALYSCMFCNEKAWSWRGLSFRELTGLTCRRKIKKNEFNFFPSEKVCLLERRIHSRFRGTFDLGLHRKLKDENSTFGLGGLMIQKPEVGMSSEVKTAAESASQHACTLQSGLLHDCQFPSLENKNRRKKKEDLNYV